MHLILRSIESLYLLATSVEYKTFQAGLKRPQVSQDNLMARLIHQYNHSLYAQTHGKVTSKTEFRSRVPLVDYDDLRPYIDRQRQDGLNPFGSSQVQHFEATSGSSGKPKWIPYSDEMFDAFQKMFRLWSHDLIKNANLGLRFGKFFFLVSPFQGEFEGLSDDREYLDNFTRFFLSPFWVGQDLKKCHRPEYYLEALVINLLSDEKVEILSFWSPRLLLSAMNYLQQHRAEIEQILESGIYNRHGFEMRFKKRRLIPGSEFPHLKFISCWASSLALKDKQNLQRLFPKVMIQAKGLLATEAPLTIPLCSYPGGAPLIDDIYYEFMDSKDQIWELHEIQIGMVYELIFSHAGGLFRYRLGDQVQVVGFYEKTPLLEFVGRKGIVSDLCGEKLSEAELVLSFQALNSDVMVFPHDDHYIAFCSHPSDLEQIEECLRKNPHYAFARQSQELHQVKTHYLEHLREHTHEFMTQLRGMRSGDIKTQILYPKARDLELYQYLMKKRENA